MTDAAAAVDAVLVHLQGEASPAYTSPYESVRLGAIAACLQGAGYRVEVLDSALAGLSTEQCAELAGTASRLVVVDLLHRTMPEGLQLCARLRAAGRADLLIAAVGEAAEACSLTLAESGLFDLVPLGDPEPSLLSALECPPGAASRAAGARPIAVASQAQLDLAPLRPHLGAALRHRPVIDVSSSRGCTYHCRFCTVAGQAEKVSEVGPRWRSRSAHAVVTEILELAERTGITRFQFVDDNFLAAGSRGRDRARAIAAALRARGTPVSYSIYARPDCFDDALIDELVEAGLVQVFMGLESGSSRVLDRLGKRVAPGGCYRALHKLAACGVRVVPSFVVFEQRQELQDLSATLDFMIATGSQVGFSTGGLIPIPGTRAREELACAGLLPERPGGAASSPASIHLPVRFADPELARLYSFVCDVESHLDCDGRLSELVTAYHRFNDELAVVGCQPELAALNLAHQRFREQQCLLLRARLAAGVPSQDDVESFADSLRAAFAEPASGRQYQYQDREMANR